MCHTANWSLKYNDDGRLTIYLGNQLPGKEKDQLATGAGWKFFDLDPRYWPDQAILDGT